jgi:hypothetical protein
MPARAPHRSDVDQHDAASLGRNRRDCRHDVRTAADLVHLVAVRGALGVSYEQLSAEDAWILAC